MRRVGWKKRGREFNYVKRSKWSERELLVVKKIRT